ncbi:hypothetical protein ACVXG7_27235 [Enterobacter hormaechei]
MDVVDYRNATSGVNVDLGRSTAQSTGFDTATLVNIEGINGSDYDNVITGNSGDNQFEGRAGTTPSTSAAAVTIRCSIS